LKQLQYGWPDIVRKLRGAESVLLFADYDGTLTPIVDRPEDAVLPDEAKKMLRALSILPGFTLGVISGRSLDDIMERVGLIGVVYAGNHGLEIKELSGILYVDPEAKKVRPVIERICKELKGKLGRIKGALVENKGLSLSVHYRLVDEGSLTKVRAVFDEAVKEAEETGCVRVTHGKKVFELRPAVDIDKGKAVRMLIDSHIKRSAAGNGKFVPIYIGDDRTDEDVFQAIEEYGMGISIFVGAPRTRSAARYYLNSTDEVLEFLKKLYRQMQKEPGR